MERQTRDFHCLLCPKGRKSSASPLVVLFLLLGLLRLVSTAIPFLSLFCHFGKIRRIYVVTDHEKSRFHPSLTEEGYSNRHIG